MSTNNTGIIADMSEYKQETDEREEEIKIPFWYNDPNVLFKQEYFFELFPTENMTYEQKMNAVSRLVIFITILVFIITKNIRILFVSVVTLGSIYFLYFHKQSEKEALRNRSKSEFGIDANGTENFDVLGGDTPATVLLRSKGIDYDRDAVFDKPSSANPFSNVLNTDIEFNPKKKPAPPSFNENINQTILQQAKQMVIEQNADQPDIADKLFKDLGENYVFEQSMRQFSSNPSTTIPNDQGAFADFCYGSMVSAKEGNMFSLARNLARHQT